MTRFGPAVLSVAVLVSLSLHFLLLRYMVFDKTPEVESESIYEVTLKYHKTPEEKIVTQKKKKKRIVKKRETEIPSVEELELPAPEPLQEVLETVGQEQYVESVQEIPGTEETDQSEQQVRDPIEHETAESDSQYARSIAGLRDEILKRKIYPQAARRRNIEGVVLVFLELDSSGTLQELRVLESSGSKILDSAALSLIKKVLPYEHGLGEELTVEIPIRYSLSD
jgi:protein TonB